MMIKYTNFDGDWDAVCNFCNKPQHDHQVEVGEFEDVRYIHRQPCSEERGHISKQALKRVNTARGIISAYEVAVYFWDKIPYKAEIALSLRIVRRVYFGLRGYLYYRRKYGSGKAKQT